MIGVDVVEVVLKLVCKVIGCIKVVLFYGVYYGMIVGVLVVIGNCICCGFGFFIDVVFVFYEDSFYGEFDSIGFFECLVND